jgi:hypothetical protein
MIKGKLKADGVAVASLDINFLQQPSHLTAKAAVVDESTGSTVAWVQCPTGWWSNDTLAKLQDLVSSMEGDLAERLFERRAVSPLDATPEQPAEGLGEKLAKGEPSQI